jgi:manganese transport protein
MGQYCLMFALTINASILILAAATFQRPAGDIRRQSPSAVATAAQVVACLILFGLALLSSGDERHGYHHHGRPDRDGGIQSRIIAPWSRAVGDAQVVLAILPAVFVILWWKDSEGLPANCLIVRLCCRCFALACAGDVHHQPGKMGALGPALNDGAGLIAALIIVLNINHTDLGHLRLTCADL